MNQYINSKSSSKNSSQSLSRSSSVSSLRSGTVNTTVEDAIDVYIPIVRAAQDATVFQRTRAISAEMEAEQNSIIAISETHRADYNLIAAVSETNRADYNAMVALQLEQELARKDKEIQTLQSKVKTLSVQENTPQELSQDTKPPLSDAEKAQKRQKKKERQADARAEKNKQTQAVLLIQKPFKQFKETKVKSNEQVNQKSESETKALDTPLPTIQEETSSPVLLSNSNNDVASIETTKPKKKKKNKPKKIVNNDDDFLNNEIQKVEQERLRQEHAQAQAREQDKRNIASLLDAATEQNPIDTNILKKIEKTKNSLSMFEALKVQSKDGNTLLHLLVAEGMSNDVKYVFKNMPSEEKMDLLEIPNNLPKTPIEYAIIYNNIHMVELIFDNLTDVQTKNLIKGDDKQLETLKKVFQYADMKCKKTAKFLADNNILDSKRDVLFDILESSTFNEKKTRGLFLEDPEADRLVNEVKNLFTLGININKIFLETSKEILENFERARAENR